MPTVKVTFIQATYTLAPFVHISNISAVTAPILTIFCHMSRGHVDPIFLEAQMILHTLFFWSIGFLTKNFWHKFFWTQNFSGHKTFSGHNFFWPQIFWPQNFFRLNIIVDQIYWANIFSQFLLDPHFFGTKILNPQ